MTLAALVRLRKLARNLAPVGSRRRAFLFSIRARFIRLGSPGPLVDPLDLDEIARLLEIGRAGPVTEWSAGSSSPLRQLLAFLLTHPNVAQEYPRALDGDEGAFRQWLGSSEAARLGIDRSQRERFALALVDRPAIRPLHLYDCLTFLRSAFPAGLTPAELPGLTWWLLRNRAKYGLSEEEILAFYLRWAADPVGATRACYVRQPDWQLAFPDGATEEGWPALLAWLWKRYPGAAWPGAMPLPEDLVVPPAAPVGVNVLGYFGYPCGLQVAAQHTLAALHHSGLAVSRRNVPIKYESDLPVGDEVRELHPYPVTISQLGPEPFAANAYDFGGLARRRETYRIGYWYWELDQIPRRWKSHANWLRELWAPTRFIADALRATMPLPVVDMLPGMEMPAPIDLPRSCFGLPDENFLFLFAFDMCSIFERKNPLAVIEAFRRAFRPGEPVSLVIKVSRGPTDMENLSRLVSACLASGVHLIDSTLPRDEALALMNSCDAYVSLHRSEGFGLTLAEAMALGKPTIATNYSGNLDFMTPNNSLLVEHRLVPLTRTYSYYPRGCRWADPSLDHAAHLMRWVFDHRDEAQELAQRGQDEVRRRLSLESAGRRMTERLRELGFVPRLTAGPRPIERVTSEVERRSANPQSQHRSTAS